jgi:autotransporter-associated beta strand protein
MGVAQVGGGSVDVAVTTNPVNGHTVATLTFSGNQTEYGSLLDGNYQLTIHGDKVRDTVSGTLLDGDGDGQPGGDRVFGNQLADAFFRLFGDSDGDRDVDNLDFARFRGSYNKPSSDPAYLRYFDFDADNDVDSADLAAFRLRYLTRLSAPTSTGVSFSETGGLVKASLGTLVLSGTYDYPGGTTVLAGTVEVTSATALPSGGNLVIGSGAKVVLAAGLSDQSTVCTSSAVVAAAGPQGPIDAEVTVLPAAGEGGSSALPPRTTASLAAAAKAVGPAPRAARAHDVAIEPGARSSVDASGWWGILDQIGSRKRIPQASTVRQAVDMVLAGER